MKLLICLVCVVAFVPNASKNEYVHAKDSPIREISKVKINEIKQSVITISMKTSYIHQSKNIDKKKFQFISSATPTPTPSAKKVDNTKYFTMQDMLDKIKEDKIEAENQKGYEICRTNPEYKDWYWDTKDRCFYTKARLKQKGGCTEGKCYPPTSIKAEDCPTGG